MYHIQRIQQIKRLFSVVSTPSTCCPSPLLSRWSYLYSSSWSALVLSSCLVPIKIWFCYSGCLDGINVFSCCIALLFYDRISWCYPLYKKLLLFLLLLPCFLQLEISATLWQRIHSNSDRLPSMGKLSRQVSLVASCSVTFDIVY